MYKRTQSKYSEIKRREDFNSCKWHATSLISFFLPFLERNYFISKNSFLNIFLFFLKKKINTYILYIPSSTCIMKLKRRKKKCFYHNSKMLSQLNKTCPDFTHWITNKKIKCLEEWKSSWRHIRLFFLKELNVGKSFSKSLC